MYKDWYDGESDATIGETLRELVATARNYSEDELDGLLTHLEVDNPELQGAAWDRLRQRLIDNAGTGLSMGDANRALNDFLRANPSVKGIMDSTDKQLAVEQAIDAAREAGAVYKRLSVNSPAIWRNAHDELMSVVAYEVRIVNSTEMQRIMEEFPDSGREIYDLYNGRNSKYADAIRELGNVGRYGFTPGNEAKELDDASNAAALASRINNSDLVPALHRLQRDIYSPVSSAVRSMKATTLDAMQKLNDLFRMLNQRQPITKVERYVNELVGWFALSGLKDGRLAQETIGALGGDWKVGDSVLDYVKKSGYDSEAYDAAAIIVSDLVHKWERGARKSSEDDFDATKVAGIDVNKLHDIYSLFAEVSRQVRMTLPLHTEEKKRFNTGPLLTLIANTKDKFERIIHKVPGVAIEKLDYTLTELDRLERIVAGKGGFGARDIVSDIIEKWSYPYRWVLEGASATTKADDTWKYKQTVYVALQQVGQEVRNSFPAGGGNNNSGWAVLNKIDEARRIINMYKNRLPDDKVRHALSELDRMVDFAKRGSKQALRDIINPLTSDWGVGNSSWKSIGSSVKSEYDFLADRLDLLKRSCERLATKLTSNKQNFEFTAANHIIDTSEALRRVDTDNGDPNDKTMRDLIGATTLLARYCEQQADPRVTVSALSQEIITQCRKVIGLIESIDLDAENANINKTYIIKDRILVHFPEAGAWGKYFIKDGKIVVKDSEVQPFQVHYSLHEDDEAPGDQIASGFFSVVLTGVYDQQRYMFLDIAEAFEKAALDELSMQLKYRQINKLQNYASEAMLLKLEKAQSI